MWEWVISFCSVVLLCTIVTLIMPEGKMQNAVSFILIFLIIFVAVKPLFSLKDVYMDGDNEVNGELVLDIEYLDYFASKKNFELVENCKKILFDSLNEVVDVQIDAGFNDILQYTIKNVKVILEQSVINENSEHIDITIEVKKLLSEYLNIEKEVIELEFR